MASIPRPTAPIADLVGGRILISREWFDYFQRRVESEGLDAINSELLELKKLIADASSPVNATIRGAPGNIEVTGQLSNGMVVIDLAGLADEGGGQLLKILRDGYGRVAGTSLAVLNDLSDVDGLPAADDVLQWTGTQWEPKAIELGVKNLDGGRANSVYGGTTAINGGGA